MKIIRERSRTYKGKEYYKYKINIPEVVLQQAGLKVGDEIEVKDIKEHAITLKKRN